MINLLPQGTFLLIDMAAAFFYLGKILADLIKNWK